jgi:Adenylate and Guanylate cyclase catalytic domain
VNTAARIESTGAKNRIHCSAETAHRLIKAGKSRWVTAREAEVEIKGKGQMQTYWISLDNISQDTSNTASEASGSDTTSVTPHWDANDYGYGSAEPSDRCFGLSPQVNRLIQWNSDTLAGILKQIIAYRRAAGVLPDADVELTKQEDSSKSPSSTPREEMAEAVNLPGYDEKLTAKKIDPDDVVLDDVVTKELLCFITAIAAMYKGRVPESCMFCSANQRGRNLILFFVSCTVSYPR